MTTIKGRQKKFIELEFNNPPRSATPGVERGNIIGGNMGWCPECKTEYLPRIKACPDCGADLVGKSIQENIKPESLEVIYRPSNEIEGLRLVNVLKQSGINAKLTTKQIPMYDNIAQLQQGWWGEILVPKDKVKESKAIISEFLKIL